MITGNKLLKLLSVVCVCLLAGCSYFEDDDPPLEGERISILELQRDLEPDDEALQAQGFIAPEPWKNEFWPQTGGYPNHAMQHLALREGELERIWSASIGKGTTKALPLTTQPVVVDGRIFTLDTDSRLSAHSIEDGDRLWRIKVRPEDEDDPVIGGGIAYSSGLLYVTTGYDELLCVNPVNGDLIWRTQLPAPARAAPTIMDDRIYVTTLDNQLLALDATDGTRLWDHVGLQETAGLLGAASPAASREIVVPAFSSGELYALRVENGSVVWSENLSSLRRTGGLIGLSDIKGLPVIDKGVVIAISYGGKIIAIDERTGTRVWQREISGSETPWVAGNHVFLISSDNKMVALGRDTGVIRWVTQLEAGDANDPAYWTGPLLASGRLFAAGPDGAVIEVDPVEGTILREWDAGATVSIPPIVAGETLYLLTEKGSLLAYR